MPKAITYIDLFSGIGGFREGLSRTGGFVCVGHCEIDKYADQSYRALFDTKGEWFHEVRICCLKTYPACLTMTEAGRLRPSSIRWMDWGMVWNGRCLTAKISASLNPARGCTLSDILMKSAEEKYFLSPKQQERLLSKSAPAHRESASTPQKG